MNANWQNIVALALVLLSAVFLGWQLLASAKAFFGSGKGSRCSPGCCCSRKKDKPD